jgi:putative molybdopterin biosynthesis protein
VGHTAHLDQPEHLRVLGDPSRVAILRALMTAPATLTQLGARMGKHPAWIRHHLKQLERVGLVELAEVRTTRNYTERFYRATAQTFAVNTMILPEPTERGLLVIVGSDDLALDLLAAQVRADRQGPDVLTMAMGSLEGLIALRQGLGNAAGCHLLDVETGEFNVPFARRLFPGRALVLVTLAHREQGLLVAPGNPLGLRSVDDAAQRGATIINRNSGSGTRLLLDRLLAEAGLPPQALAGYENEVFTHSEAAQVIAGGGADLGLGIRAAARRYELGFVPLREERYDLVIPREQYGTELLAPLVRHLRSRAFRRAVEELGGYSTRLSGAEQELAA